MSGKVTFQLGLIWDWAIFGPAPGHGSLAKTKAGGLETFFRIFIDDFLDKPAAECRAGFRITVFCPERPETPDEGCISSADEDVISKKKKIKNGSRIVFYRLVF